MLQLGYSPLPLGAATQADFNIMYIICASCPCIMYSVHMPITHVDLSRHAVLMQITQVDFGTHAVLMPITLIADSADAAVIVQAINDHRQE